MSVKVNANANVNVYETTKIRERLLGNSYVGRGIIVGKTASGAAALAYFIMGRSENSRNRIFLKDKEDVLIHPFDPSKVSDPSLIIYAPVRRFENNIIVTNGDQTDTVFDFLNDGKTFEDALRTRAFEPDEPNFTPRISAMLTFSDSDNDFSYKMSILKSADEKGTACSRYFFDYPSLSGVGHFIHTYICDGNPIPTFCGEPERVEIPDDIDTFTDEIWNSLDENNKISLYTRFIDPKTGEMSERLINKNK